MKGSTRLWLSPPMWKENKFHTDNLRAQEIIKIVTDNEGVSTEDILRKTRKREILSVRQICQYFIKQYTKYSLRETGEITGGYDHATILHSCSVVENLSQTDAAFRGKINAIDIDIRESLNIEVPKRYYKSVSETNFKPHIIRSLYHNLIKPTPVRDVMERYKTDRESIFNIKSDATRPNSPLKEILVYE